MVSRNVREKSPYEEHFKEMIRQCLLDNLEVEVHMASGTDELEVTLYFDGDEIDTDSAWCGSITINK